MPESRDNSVRRRRISDALVDGAFERSLQARAMEERIAALPEYSIGQAAALLAVRRAQRFDALVLWLGMRLRLGRTR